MAKNFTKERKSFLSIVLCKLKAFLKTFKEKFFTLKTLTAMQLKEKMDFSYLKSWKNTLFKTVWLLVEIVAITFICRTVFFYVRALGLFSLIGEVPITVMNVIFTFMILLSITSSTAGLVQSLYFSRDNSVLLTFPTTPSMVFLSKLAVYYVYELKKTFMFTVPMFIGYALAHNYPIYFYFWLLFLFVFISALPVIIAALLSIPCMFVYQWIKKLKALQYLLYFIVTAVAVYLVLKLINALPENIDIVASWGTTYYKIQNFLALFTKYTLPFFLFTQVILGKRVGLNLVVFDGSTLPMVAILLGAMIVLLVLCFLLSKPLFYKMASKPFEYNKNSKAKQKENVRVNGFLSALIKEIKVGLRNNSLITAALILVVVMPISIFLLNKIYSAMSTRFTGLQMTVVFNVIIMLLIMLGTNISIASAYSRDGSTAYLNKIQPLGYGKLLIAKLIPQLVLGLVGVIVTAFFYKPYAPMDIVQLIFLELTVYAMFVAHVFWSAELDIMNPQYKQYATFNEQANNPNENKSALLVFVLVAVVGVFALMLSLEGGTTIWIKLGIIATLFALLKITTFIMQVKAFYKEKE